MFASREKNNSLEELQYISDRSYPWRLCSTDIFLGVNTIIYTGIPPQNFTGDA